MPPIHSAVLSVTDAIRTRSRPHREQYLEDLWNRKADHPRREDLGCGNLAHGIAACGVSDKQQLKLMQSANIAIVTAHNDMLSAHQPYAAYPDLIKQSLQEMGCTGQIAAGVPAMCDGVTQGRPGMELSLLSQSVVAACGCSVLGATEARLWRAVGTRVDDGGCVMPCWWHRAGTVMARRRGACYTWLARWMGGASDMCVCW